MRVREKARSAMNDERSMKTNAMQRRGTPNRIPRIVFPRLAGDSSPGVPHFRNITNDPPGIALIIVRMHDTQDCSANKPRSRELFSDQFVRFADEHRTESCTVYCCILHFVPGGMDTEEEPWNELKTR